jgi:GDSL-like Lipase/Acylhydrolase family
MLTLGMVMSLAPCLTASTVNAQGRLPATSPSGVSQETHETLFAADVEELTKGDRTLPPPEHGILFIGSSIFREWSDLEKQMYPLPAFNRAFGGSRTWEVLHYMDKLVIPYRPAIIVYYCGSNDINAGEAPGGIVARFRAFADRVKQELPGTRLFYVSIIKAPQKMTHWDDVEKANADIKKLCQSRAELGFIDVNKMFFKKLGQPRMEVYRADGLHFVPEAYAEFASIIRPPVEHAFSKMKFDNHSK